LNGRTMCNILIKIGTPPFHTGCSNYHRIQRVTTTPFCLR